MIPTHIKQEKIALGMAKKGQFVRIDELPQGNLKAWFLRLGIAEGTVVECYERLTGGTIVVRKNRQQIAIGRQLAKKIRVLILKEETPRAA